MAAPAKPAAMIGPALSVHEKALRLCLLLDVLRLGERLWVRVAIGLLLADSLAIQRRLRAAVPRVSANARR
jgi:hypothetical protein